MAPVIDHEVHPSVRVGEDHRYGCWNRSKFNHGHSVPNGYDHLGTLRFKYVPHTMSRECRYDKSLSDNRCDGCKHRGSGEQYDKQIRGEGK